MWVSWICLFHCCRPPDRLHDHDGQRTDDLSHRPERLRLHAPDVRARHSFAFGKAASSNYISDEFPAQHRTVSGIVGLAGGMGGFVLPIMFGALMDLTGIRSSAFMLMYGVVWVSLIWMYWTGYGAPPN